jgi:hypothetical protein
MDNSLSWNDLLESILKNFETIKKNKTESSESHNGATQQEKINLSLEL